MELIIIDGLAGALSALIGFFLANRFVNREEKPQLHLIIVIVFLAAGSQIIPAIVNPQIRAMRAASELKTFLDSDPLFKGVLEDFPELREPLEDRLTEAMVTGDRTVSVRAGQEILGKVFPRYLVKAPDDEVRRFGETQLSVLKALQPNGDRCFRFTNPAVDGAIVPTDEEGRLDSADAVRAVVAAARENPIEETTEDGQLLMEAVSADMYDVYGDEMEILANPSGADVDRARYYEILIAVYDGVLALPEHESASVLRTMMGSR